MTFSPLTKSLLASASIVICAIALLMSPSSKAQNIAESTLNQAYEYERTLRQTGSNIFRNAWDWEILTGDFEHSDLLIIPRGGTNHIRILLPRRHSQDLGELRIAFARMANALCWLSTDPHPLAPLVMPHWLTLAWAGWLDTGNRRTWELIVARARMNNASPTLEQMAHWRETDNTDFLTEHYRIAHAYWLLRHLLRSKNPASELFRRGANTQGLLSDAEWAVALREARSQTKHTPFMSAEATKTLIYSVLDHSVVWPISSPEVPLKNRVNSSQSPTLRTSDLHRMNTATRDRRQLERSQRPENKVPFVEEIKPLKTTSNDKQSVLEASNEPPNTNETRSTGILGENSENVSVNSGKSLPLSRLIDSRRTPEALKTLRQARQLTSELAIHGHPAYREALVSFAGVLREMERRWNPLNYNRAEQQLRDTLEQIDRQRDAVAQALDWAETVFLPIKSDRWVDEFCRWRECLNEGFGDIHSLVKQISVSDVVCEDFSKIHKPEMAASADLLVAPSPSR